MEHTLVEGLTTRQCRDFETAINDAESLDELKSVLKDIVNHLCCNVSAIYQD